MEIRSETRIHHPREAVFRAYRDRMPEIAAYLPDIKEVIVRERVESGATVRLHNEWVSDRDVPSFAAKILKPEYLRWDDHAAWHEDRFVCEWQIRTRAFTEAVTCNGTNTFVADGDGTRVVLAGKLEIDLREIPGVPRLLAGTIAPQVEKFIVSLIQPNLEQTNRAVERWLDAQGR